MKNKANQRSWPARRALSVFLMAAAAQTGASAATIFFNTPAGSGNVWGNPGSWFPNVLPGAGDTVVISGQRSAAMNLSNVTIQNLQMAGSSAITGFSAPYRLTVTGALIDDGTSNISLNNNSVVSVADISGYTGKFTLNSTGGTATQLLLGPSSTIKGDIILSPINSGSLNVVTGTTAAASATNNGHISGQGAIGFNGLINAGTIASSGELDIAPNAFNNTGLLQTNTGSVMNIQASNFVNLSGTILTGGSYDLSGTLFLQNASAVNTIGANTKVTLRSGGSISGLAGNLLANLGSNQGQLNVQGGPGSFGAPVFDNSGYLLATSTVSVGALQNSGTLDLRGALLTGTGLLNTGLVSLAGPGASTADFRGFTLDSLQNLDAATETLHGGTWQLDANATLIYDAGTGAHHGEIINIGADADVTLNRGGQIKFGPQLQDALAELSSNAGNLSLNGGTHVFTPATGTFSNSGNLQVQSGQTGTLMQVNGDLLNTGSLGITQSFLPAGVNVNGSMTNGINGNVAVSGGQLQTTAGLTNNGSLLVSGGAIGGVDGLNTGTLNLISNGNTPNASATFSGHFSNQGVMQVGVGNPSQVDSLIADTIDNTGALRIEANAQVYAATAFTQTADATVLDGGQLDSPSVQVKGGAVEGQGLIVGDVDNSGGTVFPIAGMIEVDGNYQQDSLGTLEETLGSGDFLQVDGNMLLNGTLDGILANGLDPALGNTFEVAHFNGTLTGDFSQFELPQLGAGLEWEEVVGQHDIQLDVVASPEPNFALLCGMVLAGISVWKRNKEK